MTKQLTTTIIISAFLAVTLGSNACATFAEEKKAAKAAGKAFLTANAHKSKIVTTPSGLQYEVLAEGKGGKSPSPNDNVTVHYRGTTLNHKEFDSSYSRGVPATFPLGGVIPGWTEGLQLMTEGAKYRFYIPSELAYGKHGMDGVIEPNATLIFDIELLKIN
jgi:FKBP-type peptidyl-prolyl cis-trans isomerase